MTEKNTLNIRVELWADPKYRSYHNNLEASKVSRLEIIALLTGFIESLKKPYDRPRDEHGKFLKREQL